jgi:hypothetical protein
MKGNDTNKSKQFSVDIRCNIYRVIYEQACVLLL